VKYLVVLLIVLGVVAWLRLPRRSGSSHPEPAQPPQDMLACTHCGVHVPHADAIQGRDGAYCCAAHRQQHEG